MNCNDCVNNSLIDASKCYECTNFPKYPRTLGILFSDNKLRPEYEKYLDELRNDGCDLSKHELVVFVWDIEQAQNYGQYYKIEIAGLINTASSKIININQEHVYFSEDKDAYKELIDYVFSHKGKMIFLGEPNTDDLKWAEDYSRSKLIPTDVIY